MLFVSLALVAAGIGLGFVMYGKAGGRSTSRRDGSARTCAARLVSLSRKQNVAGRTLRADCHRLERNGRARLRLDGSLFLGWSGARVRRTGPAFGILSTNFDERGINAGVDETTAGTRGLGPCDVRRGTRDKSKLISASSRSACWRCSSSTHGWHDYGAHFHSATRGACGLRLAAHRIARAGSPSIFNVISALHAFMLWRNFDAAAAGLQIVERHAWIPAIGAEYLVGVDGLSLLLVLLTSLIIPFAFLRPTHEVAVSAR